MHCIYVYTHKHTWLSSLKPFLLVLSTFQIYLFTPLISSLLTIKIEAVLFVLSNIPNDKLSFRYPSRIFYCFPWPVSKSWNIWNSLEGSWLKSINCIFIYTVCQTLCLNFLWHVLRLAVNSLCCSGWLETWDLLPQRPKCWDCKLVPPCLPLNHVFKVITGLGRYNRVI